MTSTTACARSSGNSHRGQSRSTGSRMKCAGCCNGTPHATDITCVYQNLERGSRNHMRAFVKNLAAGGASYTPQYISQTEFDAIIASGTERGRGW
ncbi:MAG: DUF2202 domain-containing protein [Ignavibacteriae bacterium]|nr:DUF2202 domain-containing protein [Ignavibacteriota bacterium]